MSNEDLPIHPNTDFPFSSLKATPTEAPAAVLPESRGNSSPTCPATKNKKIFLVLRIWCLGVFYAVSMAPSFGSCNPEHELNGSTGFLTQFLHFLVHLAPDSFI